MKTGKKVGFVLASMVAGFLSGVLNPVLFGVRGAILGGMLALGILACEVYRNAQKRDLSVGDILIAASVASLGAALLMKGWAVVIERFDLVSRNNDEFGGNDISEGLFGYTFLSCFLITVGIFLRYRNFTLKQRGYLNALCFWGLPFLSIFPRVAPSGDLNVITGFLFCWFGLLPFLLLWSRVAWLFGVFPKVATEKIGINPEPPVIGTERKDA